MPPEIVANRGRVFTAADLPRITPIRVVTQAPGARSPAWPPLATDKVRYVGEAIAACVAPTRDAAEDLAGAVIVDYEPLDAVVDAPAQCAAARARSSTNSWGDNLFSERTIEGGDIEAAARDAEIVVTREYRMNRQSGSPMEGRAVLAYRDHRLDEIVVYASTQTPHTVRVAIGEILASRSAGCASSRPMSAAGSARRRGSIPRRSSSPRSPSNSTTRCAGSRTATSIC